jgi:hypothetical protein
MPSDGLLKAILLGLLRQFGGWLAGILIAHAGITLAKYGISSDTASQLVIEAVAAIGMTGFAFVYSVKDKYAVAGKIIDVAQTVANDPTLGPKIAKAVNADIQGKTLPPSQTLVQLTKAVP